MRTTYTPSVPVADNDPARLGRLLQYIEVDPANPALRLDVIETCLSLGRLEDALVHAEAGLRSRPDDASLANAKARVLMSMGRHPEAVPLLAGLLRRDGDWRVAFNLSHAQLGCGDAQAAHDTMKPHVGAQPEPFVAAWWIQCLHRVGDLDAAMAFAREQAPRCSQHAPFLGAAALVDFDAGKFEDAERAASAALALDPDCVEGFIVRGSLALARADAQAAEVAFEEALRRRPADGRALSGLGMTKLLAGDAAGAREALKQALAFMPAHIGTWHALGWACIATHSLEEAQAAMGEALERDRNFGESHGAVAVVAALAGRRDEAQAAIDRALRLDPEGLSARYAAMVLSGDANDPQKVAKAARQALVSRGLLRHPYKS